VPYDGIVSRRAPHGLSRGGQVEGLPSARGCCEGDDRAAEDEQRFRRRSTLNGQFVVGRRRASAPRSYEYFADKAAVISGGPSTLAGPGTGLLASMVTQRRAEASPATFALTSPCVHRRLGETCHRETTSLSCGSSSGGRRGRSGPGGPPERQASGSGARLGQTRSSLGRDSVAPATTPKDGADEPPLGGRLRDRPGGRITEVIPSTHYYSSESMHYTPLHRKTRPRSSFALPRRRPVGASSRVGEVS